MSKYDKLWNYINNQNKDYYELTFFDIKRIIGFDIDHSFLNYKKELTKYNYIVKKISIKNKKIYIERIK